MIKTRKLAALILLLLACGLARGESLIALPGQAVITRPGSYRLRGRLSGGQVLIDAGKEDAVTLILDGVDVRSSDFPAIEVRRAGQVRIVLEEGSLNTLRVGKGARAALLSKADLKVEGTGTLDIEALDGHGIQGKRDLSIMGGSTRIHAKKDGIKADGALSILGGSHEVADCQEGLEGHTVLISGGDIRINARDDGINASSAQEVDLRQLPDPSGENHWIKVTGGSLTITARGDGMDANGDLIISGGDIRISSPASARDGALDAHRDITISGGTLMAFGAAGEAEAPRDAGQSASLILLKKQVAGGHEVILKNQAGESLMSFTPAQGWDSVALSHPRVQQGDPCSLWAAGEKVADFVMGR